MIELPSIVENMSGDDYHAHDSISKSGLDRVSRSIDHYQTPREQSAEMSTGALVHWVLLGGDEATPFVVRPDDDRGNFRKTAGKQWRAEQQAAGRTILTKDEKAEIERICDAVQAHPLAWRMLTGGHIERSHFWHDREFDIAARCRPDVYHDDSSIMVDLKTCRDASPKTFARSVHTYRYDVQWAFYDRGLASTGAGNADTFAIVAVETSPPYGVAVYEMDSAWLALGLDRMLPDLERYAEWKHGRAQFTGYDPAPQLLEMPSWLNRQR